MYYYEGRKVDDSSALDGNAFAQNKRTTLKRRVVSLVRVSTTPQSALDKTGIPRQRRDIGIHCRHFNLEVASEFQFDGISGVLVQRTRKFQEMIGMLKQPSIAGVVFASLDRFFRPEKLSAYEVFGPFETDEKHLFCELGELDPKNPQDQMKIVLWGQMAGMERLRMRDRLDGGKDIKRHDKVSKIDQLPIGVIHNRDNPAINIGRFAYTQDAEKVREAFYRVIRGDTLCKIRTDLGFKSNTSLRKTLGGYLLDSGSPNM